MKFGRRYQMVVQGETQTWIIEFPFTCKFKMTATGTPTANTANFYFYNLPENVRNDLLKDVFDDQEYRGISFSAGYESQPTLPIIFVGNVLLAHTYRQGPDWITEIDGVEGGWAIENGTIQKTLPKDIDFRAVFLELALALPNIKIGTIGTISGPRSDTRGLVLSGNPWSELIKRTLPYGAQVFINKEKVYIIAQDEYVPNVETILEISEDTGIIGSPRVQQSQTIVTMIFEPRVECGQKVVLKTSQPFAGSHKVMIVDHQGTISPAVCEDLTTRIVFFRTTSLREGLPRQEAFA